MNRNPWNHILLVDDHSGQLESLEAALRQEGFQVRGASTLDQNLKIEDSERFNLVLLNIETFPENGQHVLKVLNGGSPTLQWLVNPRVRENLSSCMDIDDKHVHILEDPQSPSNILNHIRQTLRVQMTAYLQGLEDLLAERTQALDERKNSFEQLVTQINEVFWISSSDLTEVFYVSPPFEQVWGRSPQSLISQTTKFWDTIHPVDRGELCPDGVPVDLRGFHGEFRILRPDHSVRWVRVRIFPLEHGNEASQKIAGVAEDITEQKRVEEALTKTERQFRQSSRMEAIGTLAGGIAHDFNNILTAILGYTELGLATIPKGSRTHRNLQEVLTAGHRAKHLVHQILTFSRQSGQGKKATPIHMVVREALKLIRATIPTTIDINQTLQSEATVLADPTQLHQIIVNICTNAEYAMRETGGSLHILLEDMEVDEDIARALPGLQAGPHVRLMIRDTGAGMTPEVLERMFDPFFTTKPIGEGSGMGMAVVHGIVTSHGGAIAVDSVVGKGTKMEIFLPAVPATVLEGLGDQSPIPVGRETILFVDDEETIVHLGKELLNQLGYTVEVHTSSPEALQHFRQDPQRFDLVITDQTMPLLTGESLARELLRIRPDLPIILCTGFSHTMSAEKAKALGIQAYLMKPLAIRDLAPIVRHVLDKTPSLLTES